MKRIAFIFARGGSKGLPGKNILNIAGKPLIAHAIELGLKSKLIDRVIVSTDDEKIADLSRKHGAEVPFMRPEDLASDNAPEWKVWQHAVKKIGSFDVFISLPPTSPCRSLEDVENCIRLYESSDADMVVTMKKAERSPWFNMVNLDESGEVLLVNKGSFQRRQDAPQVFDMTTVCYVSSPDFIRDNNRIWDGVVRAVEVPKERAIDIDDYWDFKMAEMILSGASIAL